MSAGSCWPGPRASILDNITAETARYGAELEHIDRLHTMRLAGVTP